MVKEHSLAIYETTAENGGMLRMTAGYCAQLKIKTQSENMRKKYSFYIKILHDLKLLWS